MRAAVQTITSPKCRTIAPLYGTQRPDPRPPNPETRESPDPRNPKPETRPPKPDPPQVHLNLNKTRGVRLFQAKTDLIEATNDSLQAKNHSLQARNDSFEAKSDSIEAKSDLFQATSKSLFARIERAGATGKP